MATNPSDILGAGYSAGTLSNALNSYDSAGDFIGGAPTSMSVDPITGISAVSVPGVNTSLGSGLGLNLGTANLALSGLGTIGSLISGFGALDLANKQYKYQKALSNANLTNQIDSYNNSLEDKIRSRYVTEGKSSADADSYLSSHSLKDPNL